MFNATQADDMALSILRLPAVQARTGLSRSTIYLRVSKGEFPAPVKLGERAIGWPSDAIEKWVEGCIRQGAKTPPREQHAAA